MIANAVAPNTANYPQSNILISAMDAVRPDFQEKLFKKYGQFMKELLLLKRMQATRPIKNSGGGFHFEEDFYDESITVKANASTSGSTLIFTLADAEIETTTGLRTSYPNVGDLIYDPVTMTRGQITAKTDNGTNTTITAQAIVSGETWDTPTAGKKYGIYSNSYGENTGSPDARNSYWTKYAFKMQILKGSALVTGTAAVDNLFPQYDEAGNFVGNWGGVSRTQEEFRLLKATMGQLILGQTSTSTAAGVNQSTGGMMDAFASRANGVDISGGVDIDTLNDLIDALKPNNPENNFMGWLTRGVNRPLQDALNTQFANANIESVRKQSAEMIFGDGASEGLMATFDFNTVVKEGMTFNLRSFDLSYDPKVFGLSHATNQFCNTAYFFPTSGGTDAQGGLRRHIELAYAVNGDNGQSRMMKIWETGANAPVPTNDVDNRVTNYLAHFGLDFFSLTQCGYLFDSSLS